MAAPSGIVWGSIVGNYGRIGIYTALSSTNTQTTVTVEVWFWSKYSVDDDSNTLYFDNLSYSGSATTSKGAVSIITTSSTGSGWSESNQRKLFATSFTQNRSTTSDIRYLHAKLTDVDRVGGTMYANTTVTIPELASYTVSYNANGGSGAPASQKKYYGKTLQLSYVKPTRTGHTFQGWGTSATDTTADYLHGANYTANAAITLYAIWKANTYTVSYNANGGSGAPASQSKTHDTTLKLSTTIPSRANYIFKGWGTSATAATATYEAGANYTANAAITLYAVWELGYIKPRIKGLSVSRCDSAGAANDEGTYSLVKFDWECDQSVTEIKIEWEASAAAATSITVAASGTSGSISQIVGSGALSMEKTYSFSICVTDTSGYTYAFATLPGAIYAFDALAGGKGASIGKPAELEGVFDIAHRTKFRGGIVNEILEKHNNLNDVVIPNTYVSVNQGASYYSNCPIASGTFVLEVMSAGAEGQLFQRLTTTFKDGAHQVFVRHYYQGTWGGWICDRRSDDGDTGWINLIYSGSAFTGGSENGYLRGRIKDGVLYIRGDVKGISANWAVFARLPEELRRSTITCRFVAVYNVSYTCNILLQDTGATASGNLTMTTNSSGSWDSTKNVSINVAICL